MKRKLWPLQETWQRIRRSFYEPLPSLHLCCKKWMLRLHCSLLNFIILPFRFQLFSYILSYRLSLEKLLFCYVTKSRFPIYVRINSCVWSFFLVFDNFYKVRENSDPQFVTVVFYNSVSCNEWLMKWISSL